MVGTNWNYFDKYKALNYIDKGGYLPDYGEGDNMAQQCVTAISKLIYEWYNNGGTFDNHYAVRDTCNDVSSYANWLAYHIDGASPILNRIRAIDSGDDYEREILKPLAQKFAVKSFLKKIEDRPPQGSIYDFPGPFSVDYRIEWDEEEDDW